MSSTPGEEPARLTPGLSISTEGGFETAFVPTDAKPGEVDRLKGILGFLNEAFGIPPGATGSITVVDELEPSPWPLKPRFEPGADACTE